MRHVSFVTESIIAPSRFPLFLVARSLMGVPKKPYFLFPFPQRNTTVEIMDTYTILLISLYSNLAIP